MNIARPAPPKPIPKPGKVKVVQALYNYTANQPDELSFEEGDTLYIVDMISDPNWWKAKCGNKFGLIPSNYVDEKTESINHPLHDAAKRGNLSFLNECLNNGVSVNGLDKAGSTPLHWASHAGHMDCLERLLNAPRVQINVQNRLGDTPLHMAAWKSHSEAVRLLLDKGATTNILNNEKQTAFELARDPATIDVLKPYFRKSAVPLANDYEDTDDDSD